MQLSHCDRSIHAGRKTYTKAATRRVITTALLVTVPKWTQPRCPSVGERVNTPWDTPTMGRCSTMTGNKLDRCHHLGGCQGHSTWGRAGGPILNGSFLYDSFAYLGTAEEQMWSTDQVVARAWEVMAKGGGRGRERGAGEGTILGLPCGPARLPARGEGLHGTRHAAREARVCTRGGLERSERPAGRVDVAFPVRMPLCERSPHGPSRCFSPSRMQTTSVWR